MLNVTHLTHARHASVIIQLCVLYIIQMLQYNDVVVELDNYSVPTS